DQSRDEGWRQSPAREAFWLRLTCPCGCKSGLFQKGLPLSWAACPALCHKRPAIRSTCRPGVRYTRAETNFGHHWAQPAPCAGRSSWRRHNYLSRGLAAPHARYGQLQCCFPTLGHLKTAGPPKIAFFPSCPFAAPIASAVKAGRQSQTSAPRCRRPEPGNKKPEQGNFFSRDHRCHLFAARSASPGIRMVAMPATRTAQMSLLATRGQLPSPFRRLGKPLRRHRGQQLSSHLNRDAVSAWEDCWLGERGSN